MLTVKSYGLMMVVGFMAALYIVRRLSRNITPDPQMITNCSLYTLVAGVVGARLFYVIHHFDNFKDDLGSVFAIWQGGLELLGGVIAAIVVIILYIRYHKMPLRRYLDILAIGLMAALVFGRIGCFLNGCCFGKPCDLPWAVRFPYGSHAYRSQIDPDIRRERVMPYTQLSEDFFVNVDKSSPWLMELKPYDQLTPAQKEMVTTGPYRCLPVHPMQLYASANAGVIAILLYLFWRRSRKAEELKVLKLFSKPGSTSALMLVLYSIARFFEEFLRDDNPFEYGLWTIYKGGTISQNLSIYMLILGIVMMLVFQKMQFDNASAPKRSKH
jgi:phosphatidylglycerol:prolipoprotein diacylglycerol transferase